MSKTYTEHAAKVNRRLCTHLGTRALAAAPVIPPPSPWCHSPPVPPPPSPALPHGSLWSLVNHVKVLHQYMSLLSEAASGQGVHSPLLHGTAEVCQTHPAVSWFEPLLQDCRLSPGESEPYQLHVDTWRQANPGLYGHAEAAYHVHQGYLVEDRNMTRFLVSKLLDRPKEYEVELALGLLRARPQSFDAFQSALQTWRLDGLRHALCLGARSMPRAEQWIPKALLHEADDWQEFLDGINRTAAGTCSAERLSWICEALSARSSALSNHICATLDLLAVLMRVKSNPAPDESRLLDDHLGSFPSPSSGAAYTHCLAAWGRLLRTLESGVPPSLLCPSLHPPRNRGAWGYRRLGLDFSQSTGLRIRPSAPLQWIDRDELDAPLEGEERLPDRLYDILARMAEAATSPEVAHLMLSPSTMVDCLAGRPVDARGLKHLTDRNSVIQAMRGFHDSALKDEKFLQCIERLKDCLPVVGERQFQRPKTLLAWRLDLPPRALLYLGTCAEVDLERTPPHTLPKISTTERLKNRTVSGIAMLQDADYDAEELHTALRACVAQEILGPHPNFADHPHHRVTLRVGPDGATETHHTTTLAEAVSLFTGPPPFQVKETALHGSDPWDKDHVDERYAERQTADNGQRFRDWAVLYHDGQEMQRCRLASHAIRVQEVHETHFPLAKLEGGHAWVSVASTLPTETRMLRHMGGESDLDILKRSVEGRFMHDPKLLPVRCSGDTVLREHMELYTDKKAGQVLLAYAPCSLAGGEKRIEFISFRHCKNL